MQAVLKTPQYECFKDTVEGLSARPVTITCLLCSASMRRNVDTLQKHVASKGHKDALHKTEKREIEDSVAGASTCSSDAMVRYVCCIE